MSAHTDLPIQATHPPRHRLVGFGRFQRAQALGADQNHLVIAPSTGLVNPGHPRPPGTITLMALPGEQIAARTGTPDLLPAKPARCGTDDVFSPTVKARKGRALAKARPFPV